MLLFWYATKNQLSESSFGGEIGSAAGLALRRAC
jgi:hypothetical protein